MEDKSYLQTNTYRGSSWSWSWSGTGRLHFNSECLWTTWCIVLRPLFLGTRWCRLSS